MAQYDFANIVPTTKSGAALAADLNAWRDALHSGHRGATRPSYVQAGMTWVQEVSGTTWHLYLYDGAQDILIGTFNPVLDTFTVSLAAGSVPAAAIAGGPGSGLNADQVDGLHAASFLRTDASSQIAFGYSVRFIHANAGSVDDGKIGARLADKGLNIYGIATEANDSQRYITMIGAVNIQGTLSFTGGLAAYSEVSGYARIKAYDGTVTAMMGVKGVYPGIASFNTLGGGGQGLGWVMHTHSDNTLRFVSGTSENAVGGAVAVYFTETGRINTSLYGWLEEYFARRPTIAGMAAIRDTGARYNCGSYNCNSQRLEGYEVFDTGDGRHQLRGYGGIDVTWNCAPDPPPSQDCSCFPEETLVTLESGATIPISEVRVGDVLLGGLGYRNTVLAIDKTRLGARPLKVINGYHRFTEEHRHVSPRGWVSIDRDATMSEHNRWFDVIVDNAGTVAPRLMVKFTRTPILPLKVGTELLKQDGSVREFVDSLEDDWTRGEQEEVYSLVMDGSHTFLANGFIVSGWARDDDFDYSPWFAVEASWR